jgi:hypothetical protein
LNNFKLDWSASQFVQQFGETLVDVIDSESGEKKEMNLAEFFEPFGNYADRTSRWKVKVCRIIDLNRLQRETDGSLRRLIQDWPQNDSVRLLSSIQRATSMMTRLTRNRLLLPSSFRQPLRISTRTSQALSPCQARPDSTAFGTWLHTRLSMLRVRISVRPCFPLVCDKPKLMAGRSAYVFVGPKLYAAYASVEGER